VVCIETAITALQEWNRRDADHQPVQRACRLIVCRPLKTRASRLRRALTGRQGHGHDAAHWARHHDMEELV
jgi:hypothetical protein